MKTTYKGFKFSRRARDEYLGWRWNGFDLFLTMEKLASDWGLSVKTVKRIIKKNRISFWWRVPQDITLTQQPNGDYLYRVRVRDVGMTDWTCLEGTNVH